MSDKIKDLSQNIKKFFRQNRCIGYCLVGLAGLLLLGAIFWLASASGEKAVSTEEGEPAATLKKVNQSQENSPKVTDSVVEQPGPATTSPTEIKTPQEPTQNNNQSVVTTPPSESTLTPAPGQKVVKNNPPADENPANSVSTTNPTDSATTRPATTPPAGEPIITQPLLTSQELEGLEVVDWGCSDSSCQLSYKFTNKTGADFSFPDGCLFRVSLIDDQGQSHPETSLDGSGFACTLAIVTVPPDNNVNQTTFFKLPAGRKADTLSFETNNYSSTGPIEVKATIKVGNLGD